MASAMRLCGTTARTLHRLFKSGVACQVHIKAGDQLPDIDVYENSPGEKVNIRELYRGKKGILFSVPGAFTPGCSQAHIPEYLQHTEEYSREGCEVISCVAVNDPFVMAAWGRELQAEGKIRMLADPRREFTKAIDMELDCTPLLGNVRSKRYSMVIEDSVVRLINLEPDDTGLACLLCIRTMHTQEKKTH